MLFYLDVYYCKYCKYGTNYVTINRAVTNNNKENENKREKKQKLKKVCILYIKTSNFEAEAERSHIFLQFEAERMFLNLHGTTTTQSLENIRSATLKRLQTLYPLMTWMVRTELFWSSYK